MTEQKKRVAILGAGFAGLSTAFHLLEYTKGSIKIDLYDPLPIGKGASGISSGLLHPNAGKDAKRVRDADAKIDAVHKLIGAATRSLNAPVVLSHGILRPAVTISQIENFKRAVLPDHTEWWEKDKCLEKVPGLQLDHPDGGGLFIKQGLTLDVPRYLEGLWKTVALLGTQFHQTAVFSEKELRHYDTIIFALGFAITKFPPLAHLPIELIKGQAITFRYPQNLPPLPFSLVSEGYVTMSKDQKSCIAGATFERNFTTATPDLPFALPEIQKKVLPFFPALEKAEVVDCIAGIRAASKHNHQPLVGKVGPKFWFITGLGGKGLLYHAWLGEQLVKAVLMDDPGLLPVDLRY